MEIDIKRGYEILPDNSIVFEIRIANNTNVAISDVQVILDYNESIFKLQQDRILKLGDIQPTIARTAKFTLEPEACVHNEKIEASIIYRDPEREKHMMEMQAKEVHCICPFLRAKQIAREEFIQLSGKWYTADIGINYEGINAEQIISFLMQTCAGNLYTVDGYTIAEGNVLHFSGESSDRNTHYLLTSLIKENDGLTQVMFRAASDKGSGVDGFLNEIVSELRHLINTVDSAKEIGFIKNELVSGIIDQIVPKSNLSSDNSVPSINMQNNVMQRSGLGPLKEEERNYRKPEDVDVVRMYNSYLKEVKSKPKINRSKDTESPVSYPQEFFTSERKLISSRGTTSGRKEKTTASKAKRSGKKLMGQVLIIAILMISAGYLIQSTAIKERIAGEYVSSSSASAENVVIALLTAVNEGDFTTAFKLCEGQDFLVPAGIQMIFNNNGIETGSIKEMNIISTTVEDNFAFVEASCTAVSFNIMGNEGETSIIPVYFQLEKSGTSWMITGISFDQPYGREAGEEV